MELIDAAANSPWSTVPNQPLFRALTGRQSCPVMNEKAGPLIRIPHPLSPLQLCGRDVKTSGPRDGERGIGLGSSRRGIPNFIRVSQFDAAEISPNCAVRLSHR